MLTFTEDKLEHGDCIVIGERKIENMESEAGEASDAPLGLAVKRETSTSHNSVSPETPSSPQKTLDELRVEALAGEKLGARKLTFTEQCGAFAALYDGVRNQTVARAFGVSLQCASKISGCLEYDPDPYRLEYDKGANPDFDTPTKVMRDHNRNRKPARHRHYESVAREFQALRRRGIQPTLLHAPRP